MAPFESPATVSWTKMSISAACSGKRSLRRFGRAVHRLDAQGDLALGRRAVLIRDGARDAYLGRVAEERLDHVAVARVDRPATYLPRPRQLLVVRVELLVQQRSEERRVGKECRSRWS